MPIGAGTGATGRSFSLPSNGRPSTPLKKDEFDVATDLYYVNVSKL